MKPTEVGGGDRDEEDTVPGGSEEEKPFLFGVRGEPQRFMHAVQANKEWKTFLQEERARAEPGAGTAGQVVRFPAEKSVGVWRQSCVAAG